MWPSETCYVNKQWINLGFYMFGLIQLKFMILQKIKEKEHWDGEVGSSRGRIYMYN